MDREDADKARDKASRSVSESKTRSDQMQASNTKRLMERCTDIEAWKRELKSMIDDMISETDVLFAQKNRLEAALRALEVKILNRFPTISLHVVFL